MPPLMLYTCLTISIHAPARGATERSIAPYRAFQNFNPRSREGSDPLPVTTNAISPIFQSTLPRGERLLSIILNFPRLIFQSTLPRGERRQYPDITDIVFEISIHAPARGATSAKNDFRCGSGISIHAPARGATRMNYRNLPDIVFQSTLPRGERPTRFFLTSSSYNFNPRSREGSDCSPCDSISIVDISIHAPARGATLVLLCRQMRDFHFNPRSREGSDVFRGKMYFAKLKISIHAPARGATAVHATVSRLLIFQSTLPRGERPLVASSVVSIRLAFQSTLPRGERLQKHTNN